MNETTLPLLKELLEELTEFDGTSEITLTESHDKEDLYGLYLDTPNIPLAQKIAGILEYIHELKAQGDQPTQS